MDEGIYKIIWDSRQLYPDDFVWDEIKSLSLDYCALFKIPDTPKNPKDVRGGFDDVYVRQTASGFTIIDSIGPRFGVTSLEEVDLMIIKRCDIYHGKGIKSDLDKVAELDQLDEKSFAYLQFYGINLR